jgi:hypothetical protein
MGPRSQEAYEVKLKSLADAITRMEPDVLGCPKFGTDRDLRLRHPP